MFFALDLIMNLLKQNIIWIYVDYCKLRNQEVVVEVVDWVNLAYHRAVCKLLFKGRKKTYENIIYKTSKFWAVP